MKQKLVGNTLVFYEKSYLKNKKWMTITPQGKVVHWGSPTMQDYTQHHDKKRRRSFRKRHAGILLKDGSRAIDRKYSRAWLAYNVTW